MSRPLRVATRASALARWQAEHVVAMLGTEAELVLTTATGDRSPDPVPTMVDRGVFVKEVQEAVLAGRADVAVHSAKDLPSETPPGLLLAAFPGRADPRDALVGATLAGIPTGGRVGTGSVRRRAQLAGLRPDLSFHDLRGNIGTRLDRAPEFDAIVVAAAALDRLGEGDRAAERLDPAMMLPQVGQGALAVECRADDDATARLLAGIDEIPTRRAVEAERAFLTLLGGGCNLPSGALAHTDGDDVVVEALLASLDGRVVLRALARAGDPGEAGREVARVLLDEHGGRTLLEGVA